MNIKLRFALLFSLLVTLIVGISSVLIYLFYADFRRDEFFLRLEQKANTTYRLLADVKAIDNELLQFIDKNTLSELYNEKILIFDTSYRMIYSSIDDQPVSYSRTLLEQTKREGKLELTENENELLCFYHREPGKEAIIIATAFDKYGRRKLENLGLILILVSLGAMLASAILSYFYVQQLFKPISQLNLQIQNINEANLSERVPVKKQQDELAELANDFNRMLDRIEDAFRFQKNFIQHASHELRTPLASLIAQTEVALAQNFSPERYRELLLSLNEDHKNLSALVDALLLLSKYESTGKLNLTRHRIDEVLNEAIDEIKGNHPQYIIKMDYLNIPANESDLELACSKVLLRSAFSNLVRNACIYSTNLTAEILIGVSENQVKITFLNDGDPISEDEQSQIFTPFFRASNATDKRGFGLGLSIVKRIVELHQASIRYTFTEHSKNRFEVIFGKLI